MVDELSSGRACDQTLATCARNVWLFTAIYKISLVVSHIRGTCNNEADLLSSWGNTSEDVAKLNNLVDSPIWVNTHIDPTLLNYDIWLYISIVM